MAPGPGGTLYVAVPKPGGAVLALLDAAGRSRPGWPIKLKDSTWCSFLAAAGDGSVRVICDAVDVPQPDLEAADVRAYAFDPNARLMAGWPVQLRPGVGHLVGDRLTVITQQSLTDVGGIGTVTHQAWITTVDGDGRIRSGVRVARVETCCGEMWGIGPDGVGYAVEPVGDWDAGTSEKSRITALDSAGVRSGWPLPIDGIASGPAFGPLGQIIVTVGSFTRATSRVLAFDQAGKAVSSVSADLPIATAEWGADCIAGAPHTPIVAADGSTFVISELDPAIYGLNASLKVMPGWPYVPATPLARTGYEVPDGISCLTLAIPAVGPGAVLYLPLQARSRAVGGSLVAVGPDGRQRSGWPVELRKSGAEFWSVVVGSDGSVFALAIEPEAGGHSSATIVAIAPDGTVGYRATIVEP